MERQAQASVVVGHSYGGKVISAAAAGLPTVARLIYLAAFLAEPDEDTFALMGGSKLTESIIISEHGTTVDPAAAADVFYGDADPVTAAAMVARLRLMGVGAPAPEGTEPRGVRYLVPTWYAATTGNLRRVATDDGHSSSDRGRVANGPLAVRHPPGSYRGPDRQLRHLTVLCVARTRSDHRT